MSRHRHAPIEDHDDIEEDGLDSPAARAEDEREEALAAAKKARRKRPSTKERERLAWWRDRLAAEGVELLVSVLLI